MDSRQSNFPNFPLCELHAHLSSSINPAIYWKIAHDQGVKLPKGDFHEFKNYIMLSSEKRESMQEYFDTIYHPLLNKLSSGTFACEQATYEIISGAYRANNITAIELRNNPMKHNVGGEVDLDHVIMAMLRGMERALLEHFQLSAGLIFCLDRQFDYSKNEIIVEKAIKHRRRGVVGIDFANYDTGIFHFKDYKKLVEKARSSGLKITAHCGETDDTNDCWEALEFVKPQRIGHGIKAAYDKKLMKKIVEQDVVLEVCPLSNIATKAIESIEELKFIIRTFIENKVKFCINTDWPELIENAHLKAQFAFLLNQKIMSKEELIESNKIAFLRTFVPQGGLSAYL